MSIKMATTEELAAGLRACKTKADAYRIFILLTRLATPSLIEELAGQYVSLPPIAADWLMGQLQRLGPDIQPYAGKILAADAIHYRSLSVRPARKLVIGFTGSANLLMTALPVFLQSLPPGECDVLMLKDPHNKGFMLGFSDRPDLVSALSELSNIVSTYDEVVCLGTSAGGAAAQIAGRYFGAARAVSVGGFLPFRSERPANRTLELGTQFRKALAEAENRTPRRSFAVYCTDIPQDVAGASDLSDLFGATLVGVKAAIHGFFDPFARGGRLPWLLNSLLFAEPPPLISLEDTPNHKDAR